MRSLHRLLAGLLIAYQRSDRDPDDHVLSAGAGLLLSPSLLAVLGAVVLLVLEIDERAQLPVRAEHHIAPLAPVAAVGAAFGHIGLPPESDAADPKFF